MRIIGTGVDIVEIKRIRSVAKNNPRFLTRVFSPQELQYALKSKKQWERLAVRFAAKEAVWKALSRTGVSLVNICVTRDEDGKPSVDLKKLKLPAKIKLSISLSHSDHYAVAYCLAYEDKK